MQGLVGPRSCQRSHEEVSLLQNLNLREYEHWHLLRRLSAIEQFQVDYKMQLDVLEYKTKGCHKGSLDSHNFVVEGHIYDNVPILPLHREQFRCAVILWLLCLLHFAKQPGFSQSRRPMLLQEVYCPF